MPTLLHLVRNRALSFSQNEKHWKTTRISKCRTWSGWHLHKVEPLLPMPRILSGSCEVSFGYLKIMMRCSNSILLILSVLAGTASAGNIPEIVLEYASAFAQTQAADKQLPAPPAEYAQWFFQGLIHPAGGIVTQSTIMRDAYTNGQRYWRDHPSERANIMAGYGYLAIEREGIWSRGFEKSAFQPAHVDLGTDAGAWWLDSFGGVAWRDVGLVPPNSIYDHPRVHIVGYLSPKGHYGHLGAYEREILVISGNTVTATSPMANPENSGFQHSIHPN